MDFSSFTEFPPISQVMSPSDAPARAHTAAQGFVVPAAQLAVAPLPVAQRAVCPLPAAQRSVGPLPGAQLSGCTLPGAQLSV